MKTAIIVDDSRMFQKVIAQILAKEFKIVGTGSNGHEAIEHYKSLKPNIVLLDIVMPNCCGKEALQEILKFDPQATVIMISSLGDEHTVQECLQIGAKAFVDKNTISIDESLASSLLETVKQIASKSKSTQLEAV